MPKEEIRVTFHKGQPQPSNRVNDQTKVYSRVVEYPGKQKKLEFFARVKVPKRRQLEMV